MKTQRFLVKSCLALLVSGAVLVSAHTFAQGPTKANTLSIGGPFEFTSQEPSQQGYLFTRMQVAETLVDVAPDGRLLPGLAESWEVDTSGLIWQFKVRDGVVFHDGQSLDASAVLNSIEQALKKHGPLSQVPIASLSALSDQTLQITLEQPYNLLPAVLAHYSTMIISPKAYNSEGHVDQLLATGPYQIDTVQPPHKVVVKRFDGYWGQVASIEYAEYLTGHRGESRSLQARSGQADITLTLDPASMNSLNRERHLTLHSDLIPRSILIKLNSGHPFLDHIDARQALSLALDRTGIANAILRVPGSEANQLVPSSLAAWHRQDLPPAARDLQRAKALLTELGWQAGADGVLVREGERFSLKLITYADRPELTTVATAIQAQLAELGVEVKVEVTNSSAIPSGHQDGSLEMALIARNYGFIADPLGVMIADFGQLGGGDWGAMNWQNPEVVELITSLKVEQDTDAYLQKSQRVAEVLAQELPLIPVTFYTQQTAVNTRVKHFRFDPFERNYYVNEMELSK
ncbi:ABC transporter substrate-binding protein [Nitrincola nitratireducens]|uniref:Dipeptide-binding protein n=1 Tax=Nitrincola nitratireducens TaxID=1229521 RepID=W9UUC3_9GAMM|nr:ABC transporter substrate-binding protein [Nitrincola nitratireducens]EXJ10813.1 Dipeptide-binding protein [Nitrincola nitratireducens]